MLHLIDYLTDLRLSDFSFSLIGLSSLLDFLRLDFLGPPVSIFFGFAASSWASKMTRNSSENFSRISSSSNSCLSNYNKKCSVKLDRFSHYRELLTNENIKCFTWLSCATFQLFRSEIFSLIWTIRVSMLIIISDGFSSLIGFDCFCCLPFNWNQNTITVSLFLQYRICHT